MSGRGGRWRKRGPGKWPGKVRNGYEAKVNEMREGGQGSMQVCADLNGEACSKESGLLMNQRQVSGRRNERMLAGRKPL